MGVINMLTVQQLVDYLTAHANPNSLVKITTSPDFVHQLTLQDIDPYDPDGCYIFVDSPVKQGFLMDGRFLLLNGSNM